MYKLLLISMFFLIIQATSLSDDSFIISSIEEANKLAISTKQPILLIFGAEYCKYCNSLKSDIESKYFGDTTDSFIIVYIDLEKYPKYREQYNITTIPDSRIIMNEKQISRIKGYSRHSFLEWINNVRY